jgi:hypothetical protein
MECIVPVQAFAGLSKTAEFEQFCAYVFIRNFKKNRHTAAVFIG